MPPSNNSSHQVTLATTEHQIEEKKHSILRSTIRARALLNETEVIGTNVATVSYRSFID